MGLETIKEEYPNLRITRLFPTYLATRPTTGECYIVESYLKPELVKTLI